MYTLGVGEIETAGMFLRKTDFSVYEQELTPVDFVNSNINGNFAALFWLKVLLPMLKGSEEPERQRRMNHK